MKTLVKVLLPVLTSFLLFTSCSKDKDEASARETMIAERYWLNAAYTITRISDGTVSNPFAFVPACVKDNQINLYANKTYETKEGATKCGPGDPDIQASGTWSLLNNETQLQIITTGGTGIGTVLYTIVSLSGTQMIIELNDGTYIHRQTLVH